MEIFYLPHKDIDKARWNRMVAESDNSRLYACSWYLDSLCGEDWDALIADDYRVIFPLPWRKKAGISYIYTPFFIQQLGAFSRPTVSAEVMNVLLEAIPDRYRLVELNVNINQPSDGSSFSFLKRQNYELELAGDYEDIRSRYSENLKRNISRAQKMKLYIQEETEVDPLISLFRQGKGREVKHWGDIEYALFRQLTESVQQHGEVHIRGAYSKEGTYLAGAVFFCFAERTVFIFSAAGQLARDSGAMAMLIDSYIQEQTGKMKILDFEGSDQAGLARFYSGFGSIKKHYHRATRNTLPGAINFARRFIK